MKSCKKCRYYEEKDLMGMSLLRKLRSVSGFCFDSSNPDFNAFARHYGRGIGRFDSYFRPKWCARKG